MLMPTIRSNTPTNVGGGGVATHAGYANGANAETYHVSLFPRSLLSKLLTASVLSYRQEVAPRIDADCFPTRFSFFFPDLTRL